MEDNGMAIIYNTEKQIFSLHTVNTTYQMKVDQYGMLLHLYYGVRIQGDAEYMLMYVDRGFSGNPYDAGMDRTYSMDTLPREYPGIGTGDFRSSAIVVRNSDGTECCDLRYVDYQITKGKYRLEGLPAVYASDEEAETLTIIMEDPISKLQVKLLYGILEKEDIITRSAIITNQGEGQVVVEKAASACLDFLYGNYDLISFHGRHMMERNFQRTEITHANQVIGSRRGVSSHQYNPAVIIADREATEDAGSCYGMMFVYSGNFMCEAEKDQFGNTRALMGLQSDLFHYPLERGETLIVPETILTYSNRGFTELSNRYHHCIREHIFRGKYKSQPKPILINSWEAFYIDFTGEKIYQLAKDAAELGIDLLVLDDGWFGNRFDDNRALGDWVVNEEKLGCSLGELVQKVNDLGMKFGIWIEPEMVNEDSDLYRAHPDYALEIPGRKPVRSRNQLVLDFSRKEVRDVVFEQICNVLDKANVEYIKWDMNRSLNDLYSRENAQGKITYDYVLGVYEFAERLLERYPNVLLEGCSGGGGRFDAGMLYYSPQIWCSDNTDPVDRLHIQYGTSFFYPISSMGSHVSASPNHQTGRNSELDTRAVVAMSGTFGYELNLAALSVDEKDEIKKQIREYKRYEELIRTGIYYRLTSPFEDTHVAWMLVSKDGKDVLFNDVLRDRHANQEFGYVKLKGLNPNAVYINEETGIAYHGDVLMEAGLPLPTMGEYQAYQIHLILGEK